LTFEQDNNRHALATRLPMTSGYDNYRKYYGGDDILSPSICYMSYVPVKGERLQRALVLLA
jgi:hypothetical protein